MMKKLLCLIAIFLSFAVQAAAETPAGSVTCSIRSVTPPKPSVSVTADLSNIGDYIVSDNLRTGGLSFSFNILLELTDSKLAINLTLDENKRVQGEVTSKTYTVDLSRATPGMPIVSQPLTLDGFKVLDFVCYYEKASPCEEGVGKKKGKK